MGVGRGDSSMRVMGAAGERREDVPFRRRGEGVVRGEDVLMTVAAGPFGWHGRTGYELPVWSPPMAQGTRRRRRSTATG